MLIPCPWCGLRDSGEFVVRGESSPDPAQLSVHHPRRNPAGPTDEYWYHAHGCRQWLLVNRDTRTHEIRAVSFAKDRPCD